MTFGEAIEALKSGARVCRAGWNGKGMWLCYTPPVVIPEGIVNGRTKMFVPVGDLRVGGYLVMWTADGTWQPGWLASQTDMLATDWQVLP
jgi:hypothetical protein